MRGRRLVRWVIKNSGLAAWKWERLPLGLYCFNYHRLGDPSTTDYDRGVFSCTAERFEEQLRLLAGRFEIVNLERLRYYLANPAAARRPLALLTFDDGYKDNYDVALPILCRLGASAVFFLPTEFIGTSKIPWWDQIAWVLRRCRTNGIVLPGTTEVLTLGEGDREAVIQRALWLAKRQTGMSEQEFLEQLVEVCGCGQLARSEERVFLDWEEVRQMRRAGMDIGSHGHTHRVLSRLAIEEQREELTASKAILEGVLRERVVALAYPVGRRDCYTEDTRHLAREAGYELAFNFVRAVNRIPLDDPYDIARLPVDSNPNAEELRLVATYPQWL